MPNERTHDMELNRFWNDLVSGRSDSGTYDLASDEMDTVRRVHARGSMPLPSSARERAWGNVFAHIQSPLFQLGLEQPTNNAELDDLAHSAGRLNGRGPSLPDQSHRVLVPKIRPRFGLAQIAAALLLLLALGLAFYVFGPGLRDDDNPDMIPAVQTSPRPSTPTSTIDETLLTVTLPEDLIPRADLIASGLDQITIPAGAEGTWDAASRATCCPGPRLDYVIEGTYNVRAEGPVVVLRAAENGSPTTVAAGTDIALGPGDAMLFPNETTFNYVNSGSAPVQLLFWILVDQTHGGYDTPPFPEGWVDNDVDLQIGGFTAPDGSAIVRIRLVELGAHSALHPPPGVNLQAGVTTLRNDEGTPIADSIGNLEADDTINNMGNDPVEVYVLTLEPVAPGVEASPTP